MSQYYLNIFADLMESNPANPTILPDPYIETQSLVSNVRMFYRLIRWSLTTNNRIGALVNAYYLGCLLEERATTPLERRNCRQVLSKHYILACTRVYNLYNIIGIQQIYRSQRTHYWMFRKISKQDYCQLLVDATS
jgi:hypothetical protein